MPSMHSDRQGFREHRCPVCGKVFVPVVELWAYKLNNAVNNPKLYCSWKCLRIAEKEAEKKEVERKEKQKRKQEWKKLKVWGLMRQGMSLTEIAKATGMSFNAVAYWREMIIEEYPGDAGGRAVLERAGRRNTGRVPDVRVSEDLDRA